MFSKIPYLHSINSSKESPSFNYNILFTLASLSFALYFMTKFAQARGRIYYKNPVAREIVAFLKVIANFWHVSGSNKDISGYEGQILALGQHTLGLVDGIAAAASLRGIAPHVFATDAYDFIPGVIYFLKMFQAIKIKSSATKNSNGRSANEDVLDEAGRILKANGCIALFPQGNMSKIDQEPHKVFDGAARLAVINNVLIRVIGLGGFWSVEDPLIPVSIRNWNIYRALISVIHPNNVQVRDCGVIDFHLKPENSHLSIEDKIYEINAQLYAFFRHRNLTNEQIEVVKNQIMNKTHLKIWANKLERDILVKELAKLDKSSASSHLFFDTKITRAELIEKIANLDKVRAQLDEKDYTLFYQQNTYEEVTANPVTMSL